MKLTGYEFQMDIRKLAKVDIAKSKLKEYRA